MVLSLRFKLSISGLSCDRLGDRCCFSGALWDDAIEFARVPAVECELSRLGVEGDPVVFKRKSRSLLKSRSASAEGVTSLHN